MQSLQDIIAHVRDNSPDPGRCLISFSGGKDAWSCWIALRDHFEMQPFAYYLVPGLEVVDEYLDYCERKMGNGAKIHRYPSPWLYERLNQCLYQPPERVAVIGAAQLPEFDFDAVSRCAEITAGLPEGCWTAMGVRAADSITRASAIKRHGAWSDTRRSFYPVWDWKKDDVVTALKREGIKLSHEYKTWGRTFDGLFLLYALGLKRDYPRDYRRVLEFFPFVEFEVFRYERALERYGSDAALPREVVARPKRGERAAPSQFGFKFDFHFNFGGKPEKPTKGKDKEKYSRLNAEQKRMGDKMQAMVDPEFWISVYFPDGSRFQVVFEDGGQRDFLLRHLGLLQHGDKYLDGCFVAETLGIKVPGLPAYQRFAFNFGAKADANPLDALSYGGDPEADSYQELEALKDSMPTPKPLFGGQAEKFLTAAGWIELVHGAHDGSGHIWCHDLASALGIELPQTSYYYRPAHKSDAKLEALVG